MDCHVCTLHARGDTAQANAIEQVRAQRIMLAILRGAPEDTGWIRDELTDCHDCIGRLAGTALTMCASNLVALMSGVDRAAAFLEQSIAQDLSGQS